MKRFNIEGFSKYTFGLDGSVFDIIKNTFVNKTKSGDYHIYNIYDDLCNRKSIALHKIVYKLFNPDYEIFQGNKMVVGHLNSNPLDNHISNLQLMTQRENLSIERTQKSGLPTGVHYHIIHKKYVSGIMINNKITHLGCFNTPEDASMVYQKRLQDIKT